MSENENRLRQKIEECLVNDNKTEFFKIYEEMSESKCFKLLNDLNDVNIKTALKFCRDKRIYMAHDAVAIAEDKDSIKWIENRLSLISLDYLKNEKSQNLLHVAVECNKKFDIINFLNSSVKVNINDVDESGCIPLHYLCQKLNVDKDSFQILFKNDMKLLLLESKRKVTPLELLCINNNKTIISRVIPQLEETIKTVDKIGNSLGRYTSRVIPKQCFSRIFNNIFLSCTNMDTIYGYMKNEKNDIHQLKDDDFRKSFELCLDNGNGIRKLMYDKFEDKQELIFAKFGCVYLEKYHFYQSGLYLSLITGRLDHCLPFIQCCQLHIIPYCLLTCITCTKLAACSEIPDQIKQKIKRVKDSAEAFATETIRLVSQKDSQNAITQDYLISEEKEFGKIRIIDLAAIGKCKLFLSQPVCQTLFSNFLKGKCGKKSKIPPLFKFIFHSVLHTIFYFVLSNVLFREFGLSISPSEAVCYVYGFGYLMEEIRQIYFSYQTGYIKFYIRHGSNVTDWLSIFFMGMAFILRITLPTPKELDEFSQTKDLNLFIVRVFLCISSVFYAVRFLFFFSMWKNFGPKLKMLGKMIIRDLLPILYILFIFILSFGIIIQSLLFPNNFYLLKHPNGSLIKKYETQTSIADIFRRTTYAIFDARYILDEIEDPHSTIIANERGTYTLYLFLIVFIFATHVILMNLLIALFSHTVTVIIQQSKQSWKANKWKYIKEYNEKSIVPPPFNIIEFICYFSIFVYRNYESPQGSGFIKKVKNIYHQLYRKVSAVDRADSLNQFACYYILQAFSLRDKRLHIVNDINRSKSKKQNESDIKNKESSRLGSMMQQSMDDPDLPIDKYHNMLEKIQMTLEKQENSINSLGISLDCVASNLQKLMERLKN